MPQVISLANHLAARWLAVGAATVAAGWLLDRVGVPSSYLFGALLLGLALALTRPGFVSLPAPAFTVGQAVTGVVLGAYLQSSSLRAVADAWAPVVLVTVGTLAVCVLAGVVMARVTDVDRPTAQLGLIAGGASGIVAMTDELGGDDRLVAFMQYLRVLVVVLITPVLSGLFFGGHHAMAGAAPDVPLLGTVKDWLIVAVAAPLGAVVGQRIRLPAGTLLGPMAIAGALTLTDALGHFVVPELIQQTAFVLIGLQVGLRFTLQTVREVGRLLVPVLLSIVALLVACFGLALLLAAMTDETLFDSYLATTPGGLYAVLAVAFGAGGDTTFILAVQSLRLLAMVLLAPLVVRYLVGRLRSSVA